MRCSDLTSWSRGSAGFGLGSYACCGGSYGPAAEPQFVPGIEREGVGTERKLRLVQSRRHFDALWKSEYRTGKEKSNMPEEMRFILYSMNC